MQTSKAGASASGHHIREPHHQRRHCAEWDYWCPASRILPCPQSLLAWILAELSQRHQQSCFVHVLVRRPDHRSFRMRFYANGTVYKPQTGKNKRPGLRKLPSERQRAVQYAGKLEDNTERPQQPEIAPGSGLASLKTARSITPAWRRKDSGISIDHGWLISRLAAMVQTPKGSRLRSDATEVAVHEAESDSFSYRLMSLELKYCLMPIKTPLLVI